MNFFLATQTPNGVLLIEDTYHFMAFPCCIKVLSDGSFINIQPLFAFNVVLSTKVLKMKQKGIINMHAESKTQTAYYIIVCVGT